MASLVIEKAVAWLVPFLLGALVSGFAVWSVGTKSLREGVQCLLRAEIIRQNEKWCNSGYCPVYAKQALSRAYKAYHGLRGNDVATGLYEETMDLPERKH